MSAASGPLRGLRVIEFAGLGPAPFCGMLLSDLGADVLRIDRPGATYDRFAVETRGRRSLVLDLKDPVARETALRAIEKADVLLEGFRPGVMERFGLGPEAAHARNPKLVYGRMTGWGQTGPNAPRAGHDIDYVALSGALHGIGTADKPVPPLNLVADFGGGALYLAMGVLAALRHVDRTGEGQVIDCAMSDGSISLMSLLYGHLARGTWRDERAVNIIDGGAHFYQTYRCADGAWIAIGAIEPQFYSTLVSKLGDPGAEFAERQAPEDWASLKVRFAALFATRSRDEWCRLLEDCDACFAPVLSMGEAPHHPHNVARGAFLDIGGVTQPAPAPKFSRTPGVVQSPPRQAGEGGADALREWGVELR
ncbi:MAG: CaiB/BaiF CoA-transferase family protein [Steroidobacteraceae bacterium]